MCQVLHCYEKYGTMREVPNNPKRGRPSCLLQLNGCPLCLPVRRRAPFGIPYATDVLANSRPRSYDTTNKLYLSILKLLIYEGFYIVLYKGVADIPVLARRRPKGR